MCYLVRNVVHGSRTFTPGPSSPGQLPPRTFTPYVNHPPYGGKPPVPHTIKHIFGMGGDCPGGNCPGGDCPEAIIVLPVEDGPL